MESRNPYQPPNTDVSPQYGGGTDQTSSFSPVGRFGRLSFIAWGTILGVISNVITAILGGSQMFVPQYEAGGAPVLPDIGAATIIALAVMGLGFAVFYIIFSVRRCHDFNASGWWNLLLVVPFVNLIFMLFLWFKRGDEDANGYGPPRVTPTWEKIVGIIGIVLIVVMIVGVIAAIAIPVFMASVPAGA